MSLIQLKQKMENRIIRLEKQKWKLDTLVGASYMGELNGIHSCLNELEKEIKFVNKVIHKIEMKASNENFELSLISFGKIAVLRKVVGRND